MSRIPADSNTLMKPILNWRGFRLRVFVEGIVVGALAGGVAIAFRYLLEASESLRGRVYSLIVAKPWWAMALWFVILTLMGLVIGLIIRKEPMARGSGIPEVAGYLSEQISMNWLKVLVNKFIGGVLSIGSRLSIGREGPSVQLGAVVEQGVSRILGRPILEEEYLVTCGASAGLAAAFSAPLAGVIFALEELQKNFSPAVLTSSMRALLTAGFAFHRASLLAKATRLRKGRPRGQSCNVAHHYSYSIM